MAKLPPQEKGTSPMPQVELTELTRTELEASLAAEGLERYRAARSSSGSTAGV